MFSPPPTLPSPLDGIHLRRRRRRKLRRFSVAVNDPGRHEPLDIHEGKRRRVRRHMRGHLLRLPQYHDGDSIRPREQFLRRT